MSRTALLSLLISIILILIAASLWQIQRRTRRERALVRANIAQIRTLDRAGMARMWHVKVNKPFHFEPLTEDRLSWFPGTTATLTLAITPRVAWSDFDGIYTLFDGPRVAAVFAVTPQGVFFNDQQVDPRRHPETLLERPLTPADLAALAQMIDLLRQRQASFDPQSPQFTWTTQVLQTATALQAAQAQPVQNALKN